VGNGQRRLKYIIYMSIDINAGYIIFLYIIIKHSFPSVKGFSNMF